MTHINETGCPLEESSPVLKNVLAGNTSEYALPLLQIQAASLARRCAISLDYAAVVAALIYGGAHDCR